jgi:hypothetical protein
MQIVPSSCFIRQVLDKHFQRTLGERAGNIWLLKAAILMWEKGLGMLR